MGETRRNERCSCGSGKKYKRCCGAPPLRDAFLGLSDDIVAIYRDPATGRVVQADRRSAYRRIEHEARELAGKFDRTFARDIAEVAEELAIAGAVLESGLHESRGAKDEELLARLANILRNGHDTTLAALSSLRSGFVLQTGILLRSAMESVAVAFDVVAHTESNRRFREKRYNTDGVISRAESLFKVMKPLYGVLSNQHTHIGEAHERVHHPNTTGSDARGALMVTKATAILLSVAAELLFTASDGAGRYWRPAENGGVRFSPNPEALQLLVGFPHLKSPGAHGESTLLGDALVVRSEFE